MRNLHLKKTGIAAFFITSLVLQVQSQLAQSQAQLQQNQNQLTQTQKELQQAKTHTQQVSSTVRYMRFSSLTKNNLPDNRLTISWTTFLNHRYKTNWNRLSLKLRPVRIRFSRSRGSSSSVKKSTSRTSPIRKSFNRATTRKSAISRLLWAKQRAK